LAYGSGKGEWLQKALAEDGIEPPEDALEPELLPEAVFYREAFTDLSGDRPLGAMGGAGPIPWSSIDRYAQRAEVEGDGFDRLKRMIRAMDRAYLEHMAAEIKKATDKTSAPDKGAAPHK